MAELAAELQDDVLDRFLRYVRIDTTSDSDSESYPSTAKQRDLGEVLARELRELGLDDVEFTEHGYVFATVPGSAGPTVGLIAHMDTSADESGTNVQPQLVRNYDGGDIVLPGDPRKVLRADENPLLASTRGTRHRDDGRDDAARRRRQGRRRGDHGRRRVPRCSTRKIEHAPIRVGFTVDEEVGRGVDHFDIEEFGADFAYTLDGSELGRIDDETFSASEVRIRIEGLSVHPGTSKGKMVNAIKLARAAGRAVAERRAFARDDRGARGLRPSAPDHRHDRGGRAALHRARLRCGEAEGARAVVAATCGRAGGGGAARARDGVTWRRAIAT